NLLLLFFAATTLSCQRFTDDPPVKNEVIEYQSQTNLDCLNEVPPVLQNVFKGVIDEKGVDQSVTCINHTLDEFQEKTSDQVYPSGAIVKFFNKYLLADNKISDSFQAELVKLKQVVLGGQQDAITREEIKKLQEEFVILGQEIKRIGPHLPLLMQAARIKTA